jgi:hypothetical protein
MNLKAFAIAGGILSGFLAFAFTVLETARGAGHTLGKLVIVCPGYSVTYLGSVVGLIYGLVSGAILAAAFCWLYNKAGGGACAPARSPNEIPRERS